MKETIKSEICNISMTDPQWVAVYTTAHAERQVEARCEEKGWESYVPTERRARKWSDRTKMVDWPLFPSYCFVRIKAQDVVPLRSMQGVVMIIRFGNDYAIIPDNDIEVIRKALQEKMTFRIENAEQLRKGSRVRVREGHFAGHTGELLKVGGDKLFAVRLEVLNQVFTVSLDEELLEALPDEEKPKESKYHI